MPAARLLYPVIFALLKSPFRLWVLGSFGVYVMPTITTPVPIREDFGVTSRLSRPPGERACIALCPPFVGEYVGYFFEAVMDRALKLAADDKRRCHNMHSA
jgi:hypothetical protein